MVFVSHNRSLICLLENNGCYFLNETKSMKWWIDCHVPRMNTCNCTHVPLSIKWKACWIIKPFILWFWPSLAKCDLKGVCVNRLNIMLFINRSEIYIRPSWTDATMKSALNQICGNEVHHPFFITQVKMSSSFSVLVRLVLWRRHRTSTSVAFVAHCSFQHSHQ